MSRVSVWHDGARPLCRRETPLLRPVGLVARNRMVLASMERLYLRFLRVRPRLQHWLAQSGARA